MEKGRTLLLVEHDEARRHRVADALRGAGFAVQLASSADEATRLLTEKRVDVIVGDSAVLGARGPRLLTDRDRDLLPTLERLCAQPRE